MPHTFNASQGASETSLQFPFYTDSIGTLHRITFVRLNILAAEKDSSSGLERRTQFDCCISLTHRNSSVAGMEQWSPGPLSEIQH